MRSYSSRSSSERVRRVCRPAHGQDSVQFATSGQLHGTWQSTRRCYFIGNAGGTGCLPRARYLPEEAYSVGTAQTGGNHRDRRLRQCTHGWIAVCISHGRSLCGHDGGRGRSRLDGLCSCKFFPIHEKWQSPCPKAVPQSSWRSFSQTSGQAQHNESQRRQEDPTKNDGGRSHLHSYAHRGQIAAAAARLSAGGDSN